MDEHTTESLLLASLPQGLVASDRRRLISFINPAAARLLYLDVDRWMGQPLDAFCEFYSIPAPEALSEHRQLIDPSGRRLYAQVLQLPATSARANLAFALMLSPEDAEHQAMTSFIRTIAHEVRTPLTAIRGYSEVLLRGLIGSIGEEQKEFVAIIRRQAEAINHFINNAVLLTSLDLGELRTEPRPSDLRHLIDEALRPLQGMVADKGLSLTIDIPENLPHILADSNQVRMALHRLFDNAQRYTNTGGIVVRVIAHPDLVQIEVEDTGWGIPSEKLAHLFQSLVPGRVFTNIKKGFMHGSGLGLLICRQLIELQGGTIWVISTPGQGSRFCFTLPIAQKA
jgi:signal transduction histidine kinase